jgi:predicted nucleotidyltransferase
MNTYERTLRAICGSEDRYRILAYLFAHPGEALHVRGLAQSTGVDPSNATRVLTRLVEDGLCTRASDRLYVRYQARRDNPLFVQLVQIFSQASEVMRTLRAAADSVNGAVLVFGSYARGEDRPDSDIDVLVINHDSSIGNSAAFKPASRKLEREIQVTSATPAEVASGVASGGAIWVDVFNQPTMALKGDLPDEVRRAIDKARIQRVPAAPTRPRTPGRDAEARRRPSKNRP